MKIITIALLLLSSFWGFCQDSYNFSATLPPDEKPIQNVSSGFLGKYVADNGESHYEFRENGVWIVSTIFSSISRETIRESSKYVVRNGYIFGVVQDDSLPCELEGERYYFGMRNTEQIIGPNSQHVMNKVSTNSYIINFYENGGYTPSLFTFSGKNLIVQHFDYDTGTTVFESIEQKETKVVDKMNYIILAPTAEEWSNLDKSKIFIQSISYQKLK